jgi:hypothetical protein
MEDLEVFHAVYQTSFYFVARQLLQYSLAFIKPESGLCTLHYADEHLH